MNKLITKIVGVALGLSMATGVGVAVARSNRDVKPAFATNPTSPVTVDWSNGATQPSVNGTAFTTGGTTAAFATTRFALKSANAYVINKGIWDADTVLETLTVTVKGGENRSSSCEDTLTVSVVDSTGAALTGLSVSHTVKYASMSNASAVDNATVGDSATCIQDYAFTASTLQNTSGARGLKINLDAKTSNYILRQIVITYTVYEASGYSITPTITNGTATGATSITENGDATVTIVPDTGYKLPSSVSVTGATSEYNSTTGIVSLSNATGDVTITATCPALQSYGVTKNITHGTATGATSITENGDATVTIVPDTGYKLPSSVSVTGATSEYNSTTGIVSLSNPTSNVTVSATMDVATQYTVSLNLTRLTASSSPTSMYENEEVSITLSVSDSTKYSLPTSITVTNSTGYSYNSSTGVITLHGAQGNVTIAASAIAKPAEATETFEFVSAAESGWTATGSTYGGYTKTVDLITVSYNKTTDANNEYWGPTRFYSNMPLNIAATTGAGAVTTIKTVTFYTGSSTYAGRLSSSNVVGGGSVSDSTSENNRIFTTSGTVTSFTVTASQRSDVSKIVVVYEKDQSEVSLQSISATCAGVLVSQQVSPVITFTPAGASNKNVSYEIVEGTSSLAEVSASGVVTGLGAGTARLKITPEDTNASAITIDVEVTALPSIHGVEVGKKYAATSDGYELTGVNAGNYGESTSYSGSTSNSFPIRVVNGLYSHTVALEVTINSNTKYLSWDAEANTNSLNYVDSIGRYSSWIFAEVNSELEIRNVGSYARVLCFYGGTTLRFSCYPEATASSDNCTSLTFVEIAEVKTDKEHVQDFVDLYMHMTTYDQGGTIGSTNGSGWCKDGQHSYYLTAKAGYNSIIHGNSDREDLWANDSDFAAAKSRYEEWARLNNDAAPYDGYDTVHTPIQSARVVIGNITSSNISAIVVILSMITLTAVGGYFFMRKKKEQ